MAMFDKPKTIAPAPKAKLGKPGKAEVEIKGLEQLAMVKALLDALESLKATLEGDVKGVATARFMAHIVQTGQRPETFNAVENGAIASMQLRRKSTQYALSDEAVTLLRAEGIEPEKQIVTPQLFAINPAYASDQKLLEKVEKAITKIVPGDFIVVQEEQSKLVAGEETLNAAIAKRSPTAVQTLTHVSCGAKLKNTDMAAILEFVSGVIGGSPTFGAAADEAKQTKKLRVVK